jgi:demethylmenaquinone methyltransferase/2-methoxy-6-polyprenyl-1,4-benzoquinol methylase
VITLSVAVGVGILSSLEATAGHMTNNHSAFKSAQEKASYVNLMFSRIAGRYDRMNRLMTLGRDQSWRRRAIQLAAVPAGGRLLDVATGTGDLAMVGRERVPSVRIAGVDFTIEMMRLGQQKEREQGEPPPSALEVFPGGRSAPGAAAQSARHIGWTGGDALRLPFPDQTFHAVVSGFMMRNVSDIARAITEQRRVVRSGGRVVCLEITQPTWPVWRYVYRLFFGRALPAATGFLSGHPDAYRYLPASLNSFVSADQLKTIMEAVGLRGVGYERMMLGAVAIHVGVR